MKLALLVGLIARLLLQEKQLESIETTPDSVILQTSDAVITVKPKWWTTTNSPVKEGLLWTHPIYTNGLPHEWWSNRVTSP